MNQTLRTLVPYMIFFSLAFYLCPLIIRDTGTAMLVLLGIFPLAMIVSGLAYGIKNGFNLYLAAFAVLLFLPTLFIYYNLSAWVYLPTYAIMVMLGQAVGSFFHGRV